MACGCSDNACNCVLQGEGDIVVSGTGTALDPYIASFTETEFEGIEGDGIEITPGGTNGHEPEIGVKLDPDSTADVSVGPDGLLVNIPTDDTIPEAAFQPGMMMEFAGAVAPSGWLMCDGSLKDKTVYASLFAVVAHTYNGGADPGGNNFRLPDARGRASYGPKAADSLGDIDGAYGSESAHGKSHTHTGPSHSHTLPANTGATAPGLSTGNAVDEGDGSSHHLGHILRDTGANSLCVDADLTFGDDEVAPSLSGCASGGGGDNFTKLSHHHLGTVDSHTHSIGGSTGADGTGATSATEIPHLIVNKIIKI